MMMIPMKNPEEFEGDVPISSFVTREMFLFLSIKKEPEINSQANYYLLNFAARRDLSREALFLWINPLEAAPSIAL